MDNPPVLFGGSVPEGYRTYLEPVIFRPWAEKLISFVGVSEGQTVLDVAAGTGVVSRAAARRTGASGKVIASDISADMLSLVGMDYPNNGGKLETLECSATTLRLDNDTVDVAFCQQGFQFFPDRSAAAREIHRVLRPSGWIGIAVWLSSPRVEPFIIYGEVLRDLGIAEPFPGAYDSSSLSMSTKEVEDLLAGAGYNELEVLVESVALEWPNPLHAAQAVVATPYGPVIASMEVELQKEVMAELQRRMTAPDGGAIRHRMTSVLARGQVNSK